VIAEATVVRKFINVDTNKEKRNIRYIGIFEIVDEFL